ncbi:hypothetical protein HON22_04650 [Candidatus Peregrinibacteria bacterium]|jgi:hypothetical protein|nr:hypothetical protein [Candidatus Peregrinibacteria bacterium]
MHQELHFSDIDIQEDFCELPELREIFNGKKINELISSVWSGNEKISQDERNLLFEKIHHLYSNINNLIPFFISHSNQNKMKVNSIFLEKIFPVIEESIKTENNIPLRNAYCKIVKYGILGNTIKKKFPNLIKSVINTGGHSQISHIYSYVQEIKKEKEGEKVSFVSQVFEALVIDLRIKMGF